MLSPVPHRFLLVHPPLLGPLVWEPVAAVLRDAGHEVAVPDLRPAVRSAEGWWDRAATTAAAAITGAGAAAGAGPARGGGSADPAGGGVVVVGHSGAGVLLPAVADRVGGVRAVVFVDAIVPAAQGETTPSDRIRSFVDRLPVEDGLLPRWSHWWPEEVVAGMVPDPARRAALTADQPRLPRAFYAVPVPVPPGRLAERVAYLQLSAAYDGEAAEAAARGWAVEKVDGHHLLPVTDPAGVAARIERLAG